jgi:hypothetical protein
MAKQTALNQQIWNRRIERLNCPVCGMWVLPKEVNGKLLCPNDKTELKKKE